MRSLLLIPLCVVLLASSASATIALRVDVNDLTDGATVIVRGEVTKIVSKWTDDESSIHTLVTLKVLKTLKGTAGNVKPAPGFLRG